jgi:hypothetical protein
MSRAAVGFALVALLCGCHGKAGPAASKDNPAPAPLSHTTEAGPVKATVTLEPAKAHLGDRLQLVLTVEAKPGTRVEMPAFGEALGRFAILAFVPRAETRPDGTTVATQRYELDAPMSGRQRIPSLRIQYGEGEELLTEQLAVDIESALAPGEKLDMKPLRGALPETFGGPRARRWWIVPALLLALAAALLGVRRFRRAAARRVRVSAFDVAMQKLAALESRGLPEGADADGWYVDLSAIVRRYVEDRFAIRAPELTTEEFFREARRALDLGHDHRDLLGSFLMQCDRVKFAAHQPLAAESKEALSTARRFLDETRLRMESHAAVS